MGGRAVPTVPVSMRALAGLTRCRNRRACRSRPDGRTSPKRISADPAVVDVDAIQTVRDRGWPVFENCSRTIRASVRSDQNAAPIAQRHIRANGRFTFRWTPRNKNIGPGRGRLVARMRCETAIRIRP